MIEVPLTRGFVALIDDEDGDLVLRYGWRVCSSRSGGYYAVRSARPAVLMHRMLLPGLGLVDHANRDGLDNRRSNLRAATRGENVVNSRPRLGRRFKGISFHKRAHKWDVRVGGQYLGLYSSEEEAARAYDRRAKEIYGDFAYLNFPEEMCK